MKGYGYILSLSLPVLFTMSRLLPKDLEEAQDLLKQVQSWSDEEVDHLPKFYREKAERYRELTNRGER